MDKRSYLKVFFAVQKALFLRELNVRFSISRMGLFWTFFQPFFQVAIFITIKIFIFENSTNNFDYAVFLVLGFTAFFMFRNIVTKSLGAFSANKGIFSYKQVKPIDTIIARILLEVFITSIILCIFIVIGFYFKYDMNVQNLYLVAFAYIWIIVFSFSMGILLSVLNTFTTSVKNIIDMLLTILMYASAIFYSIDMLSPEVQKLLLLNPLTHFIEMIHAAYFHTLEDTYVDYMYITLWTIIPLYPALWFYIRLERKIISS